MLHQDGDDEIITTQELDEDTWYHIAILYSTSLDANSGKKQKTISLYLDAEEVDTESSDILGTSIKKMFIAGTGEDMEDLNVDYFEGIFDDLRVYPELLTEEQLELNLGGSDIIASQETSWKDTWKSEIYILNQQEHFVINPNIVSYDEIYVAKGSGAENDKDNNNNNGNKNGNDNSKSGNKNNPTNGNLYKGNVYDKNGELISDTKTFTVKKITPAKEQYYKKQQFKSTASPQKESENKPLVEESESCTDEILNQDEEGVDCGGVCGPCDQYFEVSKAKKTEWWMWALLVIGLFGIGVLVVEAKVYNFFTGEHPDNDVPKTTVAPKEEAAKAYIKEQLKKGQHKDQVIKTMASAGWNKDFAEKVFNENFEHMLSDKDKEQLSKFIDYYKKKGMSIEDIKETLKDSGWDEKVLDSLLGK